MSGLPDFNYPAFHAAETRLKAAGYETLNPATNGEKDSWEGYMRAAIAQVVQADGIAYLPGAYDSRGARIELRLADDLGMKSAPLDSWIL
jgi:hypothetical protein